MIHRTITRRTVEDKTKECSELYREETIVEIRVFGVRVFRTNELYECTEKEVPTKSMGFRKT